ncbi:leucine-rich repeat-containing protein 26 [Hemicordylus capensis]|uniref:leucine-rich repeat-containing protein 26 n=1 Tax=Hemicordylus capensis TaxID=884348 RepID=UPI002303C8AD|nr:leucine-rich repeat-containing protein 26 [Hemicordylus capensis]
MAGGRRSRIFLWPAQGSGIPGCRRLVVATLLGLLLPPLLSSTCPSVCSCSSGKVDCVEHQLRFVPDDLPANATAILLDYNRITALRNRTFVAQRGLHQLSLRGNALVSLQCQALLGLGELRELDLSGNYLSILQPETFFPVPGLTTLNLGHNRLLQLEPELLEALPHLRVLSIHSNGLVALSAGLFQSLPSLHYLKLDGNPWMCSCAIQPLSQWLADHTDKVPEVQLVSCRLPAYLSNYPIVDIGNESFVHCQEPWLQAQDYAFFLLVGPSTFLASVCLCVLIGSLAVARTKIMAVSSIRPGTLARRAERRRPR